MFKKLLIPVKYVWHHPVTKNNKLTALSKFLIWQLKSSFNSNAHVVSWIGNLKLSIHKGMHGATGCIYVGLPEFNDMAFLLHYLDTDSNFIDIGANVGVYSLLAAGIKKCDTICIEPIPQTFQYLKKNIAINNLDSRVECFNIGLSKQKGELYFTKDKDTVNHVTDKKSIDTVIVSVDTLDHIVANKTLNNTLIKLDVEGFEYNVLSGAQETLKNENVKAFIVELNDCSSKFGLSDEMVDNLLVKNNFEKYDYDPFKRKLTKIDHFHTEENTLYIRKSNVNEIQEKLRTATPFNIFNKSI